MQLITILGMAACFVVLYYKYQGEKAARTVPPKRNWKRTFKLAKVLWAALLALLAVGFSLQRTNHSLTSKDPYQPSFIERAVTALSNW